MSDLDNKNSEICPECQRQCLLTDLRCGKGRRFMERLQNGETEHLEDLPKGRHNRGERHTGHGHGHHEKQGGHRRDVDDLDELSDLLGRCGHYLHHKNNRKRGQGRILKILSQSEEMTQKDLQNHLEIKSGSISEIISKLEAKGMVTRERDETDKRKIVLKITQIGKEKVERHLNEKKGKPLYEALSEEEQETLKGLLSKVLDHWHM